MEKVSLPIGTTASFEDEARPTNAVQKKAAKRIVLRVFI